jgi:hypothetical protein
VISKESCWWCKQALEKIAKDHKILIVTFHAVRRFHAPGAMRWEGVLTPYNGIPP